MLERPPAHDSAGSSWWGGAAPRLRVARLRLWWERAFWVIPLLGVGVGLVLHPVMGVFDEVARAELGPRLGGVVSTQGAAQVLAAIGGGMVTFTGFVFSFVILVLQFGSSQYSPRTVSYFLRARSTQWILAVFLLTITFSFLGLLDIGSYGRDDFTPLTTVVVAVALLLLSLLGFIALLNSVGRRVRVDAVLSNLGRQTRRQLPRRVAAPPDAELRPAPAGAADGEHPVVVRHAARTGQVVAVSGRRLLRLASGRRCRFTLLVQVGDSVSRGTPLLAITGLQCDADRTLVRAAGRAVVVDVERSLRYDPSYSLRLVVDIALRALSPAVNDPTTAVRALDEIEDVLRTAAALRLGPRTLTDGVGQVLLRSPTWSDVVDLALLEISTAGLDQVQVTRRLTALVDGLVDDFPDDLGAPLRVVRERLRADVLRLATPERAVLALTADRQGLGGAR